VTAFVGNTVTAEIEVLDGHLAVDLTNELHQSLDAVVVEAVVCEIQLQQLVLPHDLHQILDAVLP